MANNTGRFFWRVWGILFSFSVSVAAAPLNLGQLMDQLAQNPPSIATFIEKKYLSLLEHTLDSTGELRFIPPDRLEKHTLTPRIETIVLEGDTLTVTNNKRIRVFQLHSYPEIIGMIGSIRATVTGNRQALERVYNLHLNGDSTNWTLKLTPLEYKMGNIISSLEIKGSDNVVHTIEIRRADGDWSIMYIKHIRQKRHE